jgi:hypothetical protein
MKIELLCQSCGEEYRKRYQFNAEGIANPYPGEYIKLTMGILRPRREQIKFYVGSSAFDLPAEPTETITLAVDEYICDSCSTPLQVDQVAVAGSIFTDERPYHAWESEYLKAAQ